MAPVAESTHLPPLGARQREEVGGELQATLVELVDLSLIGKQLHWTVVGPNFQPLHLLVADVSERLRARMGRLGEVDLASQDVLIEVVRTLEEQQWMLRAQFGATA